MKHTDSIEPLFDAIETLCTVSASLPSLPESTSIIIDSEIVEEVGETKKSQLPCIQCNRQFKTTAQLKHHLASRHLNQRPFKCALCSASFTQIAHLKAHRRIHSGERPFLCQECGSAFVQLSHLKTHLKLHTGEKPYACDICDSRFRQQSNLKSHRLIHTGERPYKCDVCDSSFVQVGHLKSHKRIHSDERPYKCKECLGAFRQISNLRNHEKIHQNKKQKAANSEPPNRASVRKSKSVKANNPFTCSECKFTSYVKDHIQSHFRAFHADVEAKKQLPDSEGPIFMCSDCGACYNSAESIKAHMILHARCEIHCNSCADTFLNVGELLKHQNQQHSEGVNSSIHLGTFEEDAKKIDPLLDAPSDTTGLSSLIASSCEILFIEEREDKSNAGKAAFVEYANT